MPKNRNALCILGILVLGISWDNLNIQKTGTGIHAIK